MVKQHKALVTGAAGFIGFHVARRLLQSGYSVFGVDSLTDYYDPRLKDARLAVLAQDPQFTFARLDLSDRDLTRQMFMEHRFPVVIHLAAQAGVRYSIENPSVYIDANLQGFANVLEGCRHSGCGHLIYASSSSVYGANTKLPFSVRDNVDHPISLYAATKKANELMAHSYSHLYGLPTTGLRFFTVYGPWGRPDMAVFLFAEAIVEKRPIKLFNHGDMQRDFTYIDDATEAVVRLVDHVPEGNAGRSVESSDPSISAAPWRIFNVGNNRAERLVDLVAELEKHFGPAVTTLLPMQPGDIHATYADIDDLMREVGFRPSTTIQDGVAKFAEWYRQYRKL
jgi:UDP-glucuronate 4-epimerase